MVLELEVTDGIGVADTDVNNSAAFKRHSLARPFRPPLTKAPRLLLGSSCGFIEPFFASFSQRPSSPCYLERERERKSHN